MTKNIYGYERTEKSDPGQIVSSDHALIDVGGVVGLVQSVTGNYSHRVEPKFEAGSPNLYWVTGQASGTIEIGRLLGAGNFEGGLSLGDGCGVISPITISMDGGSCVKAGESQTIVFSGAVVQSYTLAFSVGNLEVTEGLRIMIAELAR